MNATLESCSVPPISNAAEDEAYVPLPGGPVRGPGGRPLRPRNVHIDANLTYIWATFASLRTIRSLCVAPLKVVPDVFSAWAFSVRLGRLVGVTRIR
jgi:hypothetical protein